LCDEMQKQGSDPLDITVTGWEKVGSAVGVEATKLKKAVLQEFNRDLQKLTSPGEKPHLACETRQGSVFIGTLSAAESRVLLRFHGIRKILQLFSAPVDELWDWDGIAYKTVVLDANNDLDTRMLDSCIEFIGNSRSRIGGVGADSTLICCGTGIRRSAALAAAYFMYLDEANGHSAKSALDCLVSQRPGVDIAGGSTEMVGGCGKGLIEALKMWEWCLAAQDAAGRQEVLAPPGDPPFSPKLESSTGKRKTPTLSSTDAAEHKTEPDSPESPGKKVRAAAEQLEEFSLAGE